MFAAFSQTSILIFCICVHILFLNQIRRKKWRGLEALGALRFAARDSKFAQIAFINTLKFRGIFFDGRPFIRARHSKRLNNKKN